MVRQPKGTQPTRSNPERACRQRTTASEPTPPTSFLTLPPELRNQIHELALVSAEPILAVWKHDKKRATYHLRYGQIHTEYPDKKKPVYGCHRPQNAGLLTASKQVRQAAMAIYYGQNTFFAQTWHGAVWFLLRLEREKRALLRRFEGPFAPVSLTRAGVVLRSLGLGVRRGTLRIQAKKNADEDDEDWASTITAIIIGQGRGGSCRKRLVPLV